jgi:hypothetical protein
MLTQSLERPETSHPVEVLIPEVRRRTRWRRVRLGLTATVVTMGVSLGVLATIGAPPFSAGTGGLIPYSGGQRLTTAIGAAVSSCQSAMTGYQQTYRDSFEAGRATSVLAAFPTTAAALNKWSGAAPGTFKAYPGSAPFDVCYLSGTWVQSASLLMGTPTTHETVYVIRTGNTPPRHPGVPRRFLTESGQSLLQHTPPPALRP